MQWCRCVTVYTACRGEDQQFRCDTTSLCVPTRYVCDGENHCGDWSDELNCSQSHSSLYQHGRADATASQTPSFLALFKSRLVLPSSWYRVTKVVVEKRLLNGCSSGCGSGRGRGSGRNSSSSSSSRPSSLCTQLLCSCLNTKLSSCTFCILRKWLSVLNLFDFLELFCCNNRRNNFF